MCIQTIYLRKTQQEVPCGRCFECVKRRRNDWYIRCLIESRYRRFTYFGLLTYAQVGRVLEKRDVQLFLKRLRIRGYTFSYLIVGEYGEKRNRPHWHCLLFSDSRIAYSDIADAWRGGYKDSSPNQAGWIRFEPIRSARSIRYTVKYIYKYVGTERNFELMMSRNPAIGKSFLVNQVYFLEKRTTQFSIDGRPQAMPRYYKRKFFDGYEHIKDEINSRLADKVMQMRDEEIRYASSLYPEASYHELVRIINKNKTVYNDEFRRIENTY